MAKTLSLDSTDLAPVKTLPRSAGRQRGVVPSDELIPMQFRMPPEFAKKFKHAAVEHNMKLNELLKECFAAFMKTAKS